MCLTSAGKMIGVDCTLLGKLVEIPLGVIGSRCDWNKDRVVGIAKVFLKRETERIC